LRVKGQFSANQFQALFHAGESKPSPLRDPFNIKNTSLIADGQLDLAHRVAVISPKSRDLGRCNTPAFTPIFGLLFSREADPIVPG
jgi:hypothetical protein